MPLRQLPDNVRSVTDADWFRLHAASLTHPLINGIEFPRFPPATLQEQFGGQSGLDALRSAYSFYVFAKTQMLSLGHSLTRESRLLDFGCQWGCLLRFFWKDVEAGNLFGCDAHKPIVDLCESLGVPGQLSVVRPLDRLPYPDAFFDGVLSSSAFRHLPEPLHRHWAQELARVCRPGAVVCLTLESRRLLDVIAGLPPDTPTPRLAALRRFQPALTGHAMEFETRGFTFFPSVTGSEAGYGDAVCSAGFAAETWGDAFDLKTYIDHASQMPQAAVCLQRRSPAGLPFNSKIEQEIKDIRQSGLFDPVYYAAMTPDLPPPPTDPLHHFCARGWRDGRNPSDDFDTNVYRAAYRDVMDADINPLWHYVVRGRAEGRLAVAHATTGHEDDIVFRRPHDDVRLIAAYATPDWNVLRQRHTADQGLEQPLEPHLDLGFYDGADRGTLTKQAAMCRNHGISAWCFAVDAVNFPDAAHPLITFLDAPDVRIEFTLDVDLRTAFVDSRLPGLIARAFADERCLHVDGRPVIILSLPADEHACQASLRAAAALFDRDGRPYRIARRDGLPDRMPWAADPDAFDAVLDFPHSPVPWETGQDMPRSRDGVHTIPYAYVVSKAIARMGLEPTDGLLCYRTVTLGRQRPLRYTRSSLQDYRRWLDAAVADARARQPEGHRMVFLNSWNDWSQRAVLEPDQRSGYGRLNETSRALLGLPFGLQSPKVSVVVMSSGDPPHLRRRLESVYGQTYGNIAVVLLDDGVSIESRTMFVEYADRFPEITTHVLEAEPAASLFHRWARGLEAARDDLVWIAGGDGFCAEDFLETLVRCFDDEAVMLASSRVEYVGVDNTVIPEGAQSRIQTLPSREKWRKSYVNTAHREVAESLGVVNTIPSASATVFRRPTTLPLLSDEDWLSMVIAGDWLFYLHAIRGGKIAYTTETCGYVRHPPADIGPGTCPPQTVVRELTAVARAVASLYDTPPSTLEAFSTNAVFRLSDHGGVCPPDVTTASFTEGVREARRARSPNIAIAGMGFYPGGAEVQPIRIANELKRQGHSVVFLSAGFGTRESRLRRLLRNDVPVIETRDVQLTKQLLHDFGIEVLNSHAWIVQNYPSIVPDVFTGLTAHVATLHGMIEHGNESTVSHANLRSADDNVSTWVYTAEKNLGPFIETGLYDAASPRFTKLPNGMEPPAIEPVRRSDLGIPADAFVLCCVSRAIPEKGWAESIEAVARARAMAGRDIRLILVGKGPLYDDYCRTGVPEFVTLAGFHENSVDFYAAADMGIMLTTFKSESFPLTIIESLFAGRPFIATDVGEIRGMLRSGQGLAGDVIELDGWQVPVERAAESIARHALHPDLVLAARERAVEVARKFRIDRVVAAYVELFQRDIGISTGEPPRPTAPAASARAWASSVEARCGTTIDTIVDQYCDQRPAWVAGDIGRPDARFLLLEAFRTQSRHLVEIGTASGMSTGLLCRGLDIARQAGLVGNDYRVVSYDLVERFYGATDHRVGDAAREILDDETLSHIMFRNPATALDAAREHAPDSVHFLFIDASHSHPWPALDLLAALPILAAGATVVLHDVNLPVVLPQFPDWGAYHLFHGLSLEKRLAAEGYRPGSPPNVGSVVIPADKAGLRAEILAIIAAHRWETDVPDAVLEVLGVQRAWQPPGPTDAGNADATPAMPVVLEQAKQSYADSLQALILDKGLSLLSPARFRNLKERIDDVVANDIPGDLVETGVWRGGAVIFMVKYLQHLSDSGLFHSDEGRRASRRHVIACDSFQGLPEPAAADVMFDGTHASVHDFRYLKVDKAEFLENLAAFGIKPTDVTILEGWFKNTLQRVTNDIAILRMDGDYYDSTMTTLEQLYDRVSPGGVVLIDDYRWWAGCRQAVDDFLRSRNLAVELIQTPEDDTEAWFIKPPERATFAQTAEAPRTPLCRLFHRYGSDKCPQIFHSYSEHYHALLSDRRTRIRNVLEIGIGSIDLMKPIVGPRYVPGASLRAWRDYFPHAQIYGLDIDTQAFFADERITCLHADQSSSDSLARAVDSIFRSNGNARFDLIIDDGSHLISDMITSYNALHEHLNAGGLYIIEDIKKQDLGFFERMPLHGGRILLAHEGRADWDAFVAIEKAWQAME